MGTRLIAQGLNLSDDDPSVWNLTHPEVVERIHRLDVAAGSDALVTNTFGANAAWLTRFGRKRDVAAINRRAVGLAREAAGPDRFLLGSIGPTAAQSRGAYREQGEALIEAGVDAILLETHTTSQALIGLAEIGRASVPIVVSLFRWDSPAEFIALAEAGADILGWNCLSLCSCRRLAESGRGVVSLPLFAKPGGNLSKHREVSPRSFALGLPGLLRRGVRLIGGCCGTTEAHVAAMRSALDLAIADALSYPR